MVVVPKSNGIIRICVDQTKFDVCKECYIFPSVEQVLAQIEIQKFSQSLIPIQGFGK